MKDILKYLIVCSLFLLVIFVPARMSYAAEVHEYSMWLQQGESFTLEQYLSENETMAAGCSEDCFDIDLFLYDAMTKKTVHQDTKTNTNPKITAPYDSDFVVNLLLSNCAARKGCKVWIDLVDE